jgi:hypothetical protein
VLSNQLIPLHPSNRSYKKVFKELKDMKDKFDMLKTRFNLVPEKHKDHHQRVTMESKCLSNIASQIKFQSNHTDPAEFLKKISMFFKSENIPITPDLFCRAILRVLISNETTLSANRFEQNIMHNDAINRNISFIQNAFVKLYPNKNVLSLEREFWNLRFNLTEFKDPTTAMSEFINRFELVSLNLCLDLDSPHSLSFLRSLLPPWLANPIYQQDLLKQNISKSESLEAPLFDWKSLGTFQLFTTTILDTYGILLREKKVPLSRSFTSVSVSTPSPTAPRANGSNPTLTKGNLFCNYCKRTNHNEASCRIKARDEENSANGNENNKKSKFNLDPGSNREPRHRGFIAGSKS